MADVKIPAVSRHIRTADAWSVHYALPWKTSGHTAVLPMPRTVPDISMHCRLRQ